jgi:hypothetical protein
MIRGRRSARRSVASMTVIQGAGHNDIGVKAEYLEIYSPQPLLVP